MSDIIENVELTAEEEPQQLSEILQIRRDKLAALVDAGQNPFEKVKFDFDTYTKEIHERF